MRRLAFAVRGTDDLFLDFRGGTIERLEVNGTLVERPDRPGARIVLPGALLVPDTRVRVVYANVYDCNGDGFHRFVDPVDGEVYLYSNFEPFEAHRLFPCFDQPDLKGSLAIRVTAPSQLGRRVQQPDRAGRRSRRRAAHAPLRHHAAHLHLPCRSDRGAVRRRPRRPPRDPTRGVEPTVRGAVRGRGRDLCDHAPGDGLLRSPLRATLPVCEVRPALRPRVQCRGDGERRRRHVHGAARLPGPAHRDPAPGPGGDHPPRAGPHVVRRPGHDALVGRHLAERELRDVRLHARAVGGDALRGRLARLPCRHEAVGLPGRRSLHDAPHLGCRSRHGRHVLQLRRDHLRQRRGSAQAARGLGGPRRLLRGPAPLLRAPRLGERLAGRLHRRAGGGERSRPRGLGAALGRDVVDEHLVRALDRSSRPDRATRAGPGSPGFPSHTAPACAGDRAHPAGAGRRGHGRHRARQDRRRRNLGCRRLWPARAVTGLSERGRPRVRQGEP